MSPYEYMQSNIDFISKSIRESQEQVTKDDCYATLLQEDAKNDPAFFPEGYEDFTGSSTNDR